jgi:uncharacterized membrane protein
MVKSLISLPHPSLLFLKFLKNLQRTMKKRKRFFSIRRNRVPFSEKKNYGALQTQKKKIYSTKPKKKN